MQKGIGRIIKSNISEIATLKLAIFLFEYYSRFVTKSRKHPSNTVSMARDTEIGNFRFLKVKNSILDSLCNQ